MVCTEVGRGGRQCGGVPWSMVHWTRVAVGKGRLSRVNGVSDARGQVQWAIGRLGLRGVVLGRDRGRGGL